MKDFIEPAMPGGITGNGRMLCSIRDDGSLHRLFWPRISWGQHMGILKIGVQEAGCSVAWLDSELFRHTRYYHENTNIFTTEMINSRDGLEVSQTDFVLPDKDVLVRIYDLKNTRSCTRSFNLIAYLSLSIDESENQDCMYYLEAVEALVQYRRDVYFALKSPDRHPVGFNCGRRNAPSDPFEKANYGDLSGNRDNIKSSAGAMGWEIGVVEPGGRICVSLTMSAAHNENDLIELVNMPSPGSENLHLSTAAYWRGWLGPAGKKSIDAPLFSRSLLTLKMLTDAYSGASIAAPEFDSYYMGSGGYGYCWPRDGMFVALALDEAGYHREAGMFYEFAAGVQNPDGSWEQRYFTDGLRASTWGRQIDQVGAVLWGCFHHFSITGDGKFLEKIKPTVYSAAGYLTERINTDNGLQTATMDLWEDNMAQSTYASAAAYGGLKGAAGLAGAWGDGKSQKKWEENAELLKLSILKHQWSEAGGTFTRSAGSGNQVDISLIGLTFPYRVFEADSTLMRSTAAVLEDRLLNRRVGGFKRYENDTYAGGNPWVLAALWMSIFCSLGGEKEKAAGYIRWSEANSSQAGLLPEQVHRDYGGPAWVLPLGWSHAMYILAALALEGKLSETAYKD